MLDGRLLRAIKIAAGALIAGAAFIHSASAEDIENVLRQLPVKGLPDGQPSKETPLPQSILPAQRGVSAPTVQPFVLKDVAIDGATAFDIAAFRPRYQRYLSRMVDISDLGKIAEDMTTMYRDAGFVLSRAVIPPQDVTAGVLHVRVIEGYVSEIVIEGNVPELAAYGADLKAERPVRLATLERTLYLMGDVAGVHFKASRMVPDDTDLARHKLIVTAERKSYGASLYSDNRGRPEAGPWQAYAQTSATSLVTFGDKLSFGYFFVPDQPNELLIGEANYLVALGHSGATLTLDGLVSRNNRGNTPPDLTNESDSTRFFAQLTYPLMRGREQSLWLHAGMEKLSIHNEAAGALNYQDDLAIVHAAATLRQMIGDSVATAYVEVADGFERDGAGIPHSRADADGRFVKASMQTTLAQNLWAGFSLFGEIDGQVSDRPLLLTEQFALGGARIGRGYDIGEITGDDGVGGVVELRFDDQPFNWLGYEVYGFYDAGMVWVREAAPGAQDASLNSAGAGIRLSFPHALYVSYEAAKPLTLTPAVPGNKDVRHFFSLSIAL